MKATIILTMLPLALLGYTALPKIRPPPEAPIPIIRVATEGVSRVDMDASTFRARWSPVTDMPMTIEGPVYYASEPTIPLPQVRPTPPESYEQEVQVRRPRRVYDTCTRHGMRKVHYGKRWRCRR
jgi:hypothetical protein